MSVRDRVRAGGSAMAYTVLAVPGGLLVVVAVALFVLGAAIGAAGLGTGALRAAGSLCRAVARLDRRAANTLLHAQVPPLPSSLLAPENLSADPRAVLGDRRTWRLVAHTLARPFVAAAALATGGAAVTTTVSLAVLGVEGILGVGSTDVIGPFDLEAPAGVACLLLALPCGVLAVALLEVLARALRAFVRILLAPRSDSTAPVRELLAKSLGDRSLSIAYWLEDRGAFFDEAGRRVELPDPRSGRAWTAVDHDGRRVAAIIHDAALDASPELVQAVAAAAALALDNERLKADLRARVEELRVSRLRIVEASDNARRRLERDLHDGAQQQLVALALELRLLKAKLRDHEAAGQVDVVSGKLQEALAELRELARGIHPAILTQQGLGPAIRSLAGRVPAIVEEDVLEERLPAPVEAAAYFVVAEALTNVAKYAKAEEVLVRVAREDGDVVVEVRDDGAGGADPAAGSGLRGLHDRLGALDGTLAVASPPGGGTTLTARIPLAAAEVGA